MFINPKFAIEQQWVQFPPGMVESDIEKCIQPNAIDFTIDRVFQADQRSQFKISEETKQMRLFNELHPWNGFWELDTGVYDIMSDFHVSVPAGVAAMLIVRSTLNRNGLFITSGLYDSGFTNYIGCCLHNRGPKALIAPGTRVGQLIFIQSETAKLYSGQYNQSVGEHWSTSVNNT